MICYIISLFAITAYVDYMDLAVWERPLNLITHSLCLLYFLITACRDRILTVERQIESKKRSHKIAVVEVEKGGWCHILPINTLRPRQSCRHFANDIFKCIYLNENVWISLKISLNFVLKDRINNIPALIQIMARHRPGDKPLSHSMFVSLLMHKCVTRPQWVNIHQVLRHWNLSKVSVTLKYPCQHMKARKKMATT